MTDASRAIAALLKLQSASGKPFAIVLAGHNGSGKSTMWYRHLADTIRIPLVNADRMMMSILPEPRAGTIPGWATDIRDKDESWMQVAQRGVQAFVAQAMTRNLPFAMETVFSHWRVLSDGRIDSKITLIRRLQRQGYFVALLFVGLASADMSVLRVSARVAMGGHDVALGKLRSRFPRTQKAVGRAIRVADAAILFDNSRSEEKAFTVCRVQAKKDVVYDIRRAEAAAPAEIRAWLDVVAPP